MSMSLLLGWGWGAYARDKNISARLCTKKAGGGAYARGGGIFAGHYGTLHVPLLQYIIELMLHVYILHSRDYSCN